MPKRTPTQRERDSYFVEFLLRAIPKPGAKVSVIGYVTDRLTSLILSGALRQGDRLPYALVLAEHLEVSKTAVNHAYASLKERGIVQSRGSAGTWIVDTLPVIRARLADTVALGLTLGNSPAEIQREFTRELERAKGHPPP